jgi:hypothetical protein
MDIPLREPLWAPMFTTATWTPTAFQKSTRPFNLTMTKNNTVSGDFFPLIFELVHMDSNTEEEDRRKFEAKSIRPYPS